jgi:hypothetical protein
METVAVSGLQRQPRKKVYRWFVKGRAAIYRALGGGEGAGGADGGRVDDATTALKMFTKVLAVQPAHQGAMYGKAVAQQQLGLYEAAGYTNAALLDRYCI